MGRLWRLCAKSLLKVSITIIILLVAGGLALLAKHHIPHEVEPLSVDLQALVLLKDAHAARLLLRRALLRVLHI